MAIEHDIKVIRKNQTLTRAKSGQEFKTIDRRLSKHDKQFQTLNSAIGLLPTQDVITKTIQDTIKIVVNGKIDLIDKKVDMVGEHLKAQDATAQTQGTAIKDLSEKIAPLDGAKNWLGNLGTIIIYVGGIALALEAVIQIYQFFHHAN